jgi:hypothetical protein
VKKRPETSARESRAWQNILVHTRHPAHRQNPPGLPALTSSMGSMLYGKHGKLTDDKLHTTIDGFIVKHYAGAVKTAIWSHLIEIGSQIECPIN